MKRIRILISGALLACFSMAANADIIIYTGLQCEGGSGSGCVENVLFNQGDTGTTLTGRTNNSGDLVNVTSNEELIAAGGGQGQISSTDGNGFMEADIYLQDPLLGFTTFQFNLKVGQDGTNGLVTLIFTDQFGTDFTGDYLLGNGENKFSATSINGQVIVNARFQSTISVAAIEDLKQIRLDPAARIVPEPGTLALLGFGLLGMGLARRRRNWTT